MPNQPYIPLDTTGINPHAPCGENPGSERKMAILCLRNELGIELWNPNDLTKWNTPESSWVGLPEEIIETDTSGVVHAKA